MWQLRIGLRTLATLVGALSPWAPFWRRREGFKEARTRLSDEAARRAYNDN